MGTTMTREQLHDRLHSLRRKADNAAWWLILHEMDHPQFDDVAAAHTGLRAQMKSLRRELGEPDEADTPYIVAAG